VTSGAADRPTSAVIAGPIRDVLLPSSDRIALVQVVVVIILTVCMALAVRRERSLVLLVVGVGMVVLGLMAMRTLH
jgi:hypothetical protein